MKIRIMTLAMIFGLALITNKAQAQELGFSAGLDIALPMGDFGDLASMGVGLAVGAEYGLNDNLALTLHTGYDILFVDSDLKDFIASVSMIPAQVGAKYYFDEVRSGAYGQVQIGIHSVSTKTEDFDAGFGVTVEGETTSDSNLSFAFGGGYMLNENIDLGLRYNIITTDVEDADPSSYVGIRAAYMF